MKRLLFLIMLAMPAIVLAQTYPTKPVKLVVPYAAGGGVDTVARALAQELSGGLGQPVVVENRPGANSLIGTDYVAKQAADGYTLLITVGSHYALPFLARNVPYDTVKDFTPITIVAKAPQALVVNATVPVKTAKELVEYVRANKGKISYGTSGAGTSQHLGGESLNAMAGLDMVHVPYKGGAPALNDVVGGQIPVAILILSNVLPHVKSGKLRAIGVIEASRAKAAPEVPTVAEGGVPGFSVPDTWIGIIGPAGLPPAVVERINAELQKAANNAAVRTRLDAAGFEVNLVAPDEFARQAPRTVESYRKIISAAGIKPE
ncbi:MAG: Bug family tripartite tricarboxylate transporter substrate binding protein [Burkholderiaceae bacterium]